jgi:hypothetical protein
MFYQRQGQQADRTRQVAYLKFSIQEKAEVSLERHEKA